MTHGLKKLMCCMSCVCTVFTTAMLISCTGATANAAEPGEPEETQQIQMQKYNAFSYYINEEDQAVIAAYSGRNNSLVIPASIDERPVTAIGEEAFINNPSLKTIIFPDTLKAIGSNAFAGCSNLKEVTIPETVHTLAENSFGIAGETQFVVKITGKTGSAAEEYANTNGIVFFDPSLPASISLNKTSAIIKNGSKINLSALIYPETAAGTKITWTSDNEETAVVENGTVTAKGLGKAVITAETENGLTASCEITVRNILKPTLRLNATNITMGRGERYSLKATLNSDTAEPIKWSSSASSVAKISAGQIIARKTGTTVITAYTDSGLKAQCSVTVLPPPKSLTLSKKDLSIGVGESYKITMSIPKGTASITKSISSSNNNILKVVYTGDGAIITALSKGNAKVCASAYSDTLKAYCNVTVKDAPTSIKLNYSVLNMRVGESAEITSIIPGNSAAATRTYKFSNPGIVSISKKSWTAQFKAVKEGTTWVTVKIYNGLTAKCKVVISNAPKIYLSPSNQSGNLYAYGNTNEMDQCNRIADAAKIALERCGFIVKKAPKAQNMYVSIDESNAWGADLHMPIHTNGGGGNGTMCMVYKKTSEAMKYAQPIYDEVQAVTPGKINYGIQEYPKLNELYRINKMAVYTEVDFHDNPYIAKWIIEHPDVIGEALAKGVCKAYGMKYIAP